jgi:cytoskeletal protein CcmA (bactofilin family)
MAPNFNSDSSEKNFLAKGITIKGSLSFSNDIEIDGKIEGPITSSGGKLTVGEGAEIKGDINVAEIRICGKIDGNITVTRCELKNSANVSGDITTKKLSMEEGAKLSGRTEIG